jgi:hypothetical protein
MGRVRFFGLKCEPDPDPISAPAVKASTVPNIEAVWQEDLILRKRWLEKFVSKSVLGAAAA